MIVLAILAGGSYGLFEYHHNNNERYQEVANQKVGEPPSYICGVLPSPLRLSCSPIATDSADDSDKAVKYDLNAQQDMAFAAFGVLFASVASVLLSIAAIYFVIRTLNATRQTNLITRDMGERQIRAYLGAGEVKGVNVGGWACAIFYFDNHQFWSIASAQMQGLG